MVDDKVINFHIYLIRIGRMVDKINVFKNDTYTPFSLKVIWFCKVFARIGNAFECLYLYVRSSHLFTAWPSGMRNLAIVGKVIIEKGPRRLSFTQL